MKTNPKQKELDEILYIQRELGKALMTINKNLVDKVIVVKDIEFNPFSMDINLRVLKERDL